MSKHPSAAKAISFSDPLPDGSVMFTYEKQCGTREMVIFDHAQLRYVNAMSAAKLIEPKPEVPFE
jgi:hypothetical protein